MTKVVVRFVVLASVGFITAQPPLDPPINVKIGVYLEGGNNSTVTMLQEAAQYVNVSIQLPANYYFTQNVIRVDEPNEIDAATAVCSMLEEGVSGVISYVSCASYELLNSQLGGFQIPHIAVTHSVCPASQQQPTPSKTKTVSHPSGVSQPDTRAQADFPQTALWPWDLPPSEPEAPLSDPETPLSEPEAPLFEPETPPSYTLHMRVQPRYLTDVVLSIIERQRWKVVFIVYDRSIDKGRLQNFLTTLGDMSTKTALFNVEPSAYPDLSEEEWKVGLKYGIRSALRTYDVVSASFVVFCKQDVALHFLQAVVDVDVQLTNMNYFFVVANEELDPGAFEQEQWKTGNLVLVKSNLPSLKDRSCATMNAQLLQRMPDHVTLASSYLVDGFLLMAGALGDTVIRGNWSDPTNVRCYESKLSTWSEGLNVRQHLMQKSVSGINEKCFFDDQGFNGHVQFDVVGITDGNRPHGALRRELMATWSPQTGLKPTQDRMNIFPHTYYDLGGKTINITAKSELPFTIKTDYGNGTVKWSGFLFDITNELASRMNFEYNVIEPPDDQYGSEDENRSWTGMVGMVKRREVEMAVGPFSVTAEREAVVDYTHSFMEDGAGILMSRPSPRADDMVRIFLPFHQHVWYCICSAVILVGLILFIINNLTPYSARKQDPESSSQDEVSLCMNLWVVFSSYMEQGAAVYPKSISGRIVFVFWWLFTIIMVATYTANLAAYLTVTIIRKPVNSLEELARSTSVTPLIQSGTNLQTLFQYASDGTTYKTIWNRMQGLELLTDTDQTIARVEENQPAFAFMTDSTILHYKVNQNCEKFVIADEVFNSVGMGFLVPEDAPYTAAFSFNIIKLQESGLIERWRAQRWSEGGSCDTSSGPTNNAEALTISSFSGMFLVVAAATATAILLLLVECLLAGLGIGMILTGQGLVGVKAKRSYNSSHWNSSVTDGRNSTTWNNVCNEDINSFRSVRDDGILNVD